MRCRSVLTRVDALRTGELRDDEREVVAGHLETCRSCDASVHDVRSLATVMKSLAEKPPRSCRESIQCSDAFDAIEDLWIGFAGRSIRMIVRGGSEREFRARYVARFGRGVDRQPLPDVLRDEIARALNGKGAATTRVDLGEAHSALERDVLTTLTHIPRGEVRSYSWVAQQVGRPRAVRAVANVVANNCLPFVVPCHRVVPAEGGVGQYAFGSELKRELLRREGVDVDELEALKRAHVRFIGSQTTRIVCVPTCKDARRIREENCVAFRDADEAGRKGFRPCQRCQPFAA